MSYIQRKKTAENPSKQEEVALEFRKCVYRQWREQQQKVVCFRAGPSQIDSFISVLPMDIHIYTLFPL